MKKPSPLRMTSQEGALVYSCAFSGVRANPHAAAEPSAPETGLHGNGSGREGTQDLAN